jgi:hypothetical protein
MCNEITSENKVYNQYPMIETSNNSLCGRVINILKLIQDSYLESNRLLADYHKQVGSYCTHPQDRPSSKHIPNLSGNLDLNGRSVITLKDVIFLDSL